MPDYTRTRFYKLINDETEDIYIGGTTQSLSARMAEHRIDARRNEDYFMNILGIDKWRIVLIKVHKCKDKEEANAIEQKYIEKYKPFFNKVNPIAKNQLKKESDKRYRSSEKGKLNSKQNHIRFNAKRREVTSK